jgi:hypothetical protein
MEWDYFKTYWITDRSSSRQIIRTWRIWTSHWPERYCGGSFTYRIKISTCAMFLGRRFTKEYQMLYPGCACRQDRIRRSISSEQ